jgi:hypothetical protein
MFFAEAVQRNADPASPFKFSIGTMDGVLGYANVRNRCVMMFLAGPCDRLWFVDADILPPPDVFELPKVDADIVTLPYPFTGTMCPAICNYKDINDFSKGMMDIEPDESGVADVNGTGMGCTIIRRRVLEDPGMRYEMDYVSPDGRAFDLADEPGEAPPIFRYHMKPNGQVLQGEDFNFCIRAKRLGYSVKVRLKSQCDHLKQVALNQAFKTVEAHFTQKREDTKVYAA